ncbi:MAG: hypothetical protein N2449_01000 [Bacteroidales bacterium]|nr:hypothetical protein [Bacteroidales bacterium]
MMNFYLLLIFFCFFSLITLAQGELNPEARVVTTNEHSYLVSLNSNGFSASYQYGKRIDGFRKRTVDIDFSYIKHPKEIRVENPYYQSQKKFVFGKLNTLFAIRSGMGKQKEIFSIFDKGGIAIRYHYSLGATLALLKPVYYEVVDSTKIYNNVQYIYISDKQFDYSIHQISDIYSRSSFFKGINETKFIPGLHLKGGFSFVFSEKYEAINAIEVGAIADVFVKPIQIMANEKKDRLFVTLYVGYRFGKIKVRNKESAKSLIEKDEETD